MGVVYKAQDLRLQRCVALKFLPDYLKHDHQALERLRREALAASALNHPNICTLHDIDEHSGQPVLVMELIEGDTLRGYTRGKPLPVDELWTSEHRLRTHWKPRTQNRSFTAISNRRMCW